ncbi:MAG: Similarity [uncultured Sulfurovum sp.]|uniref:Similarity n=1 Tax=uncultured Sulfurovum sp. TaxID=269237 RepID=A0A6S6SX20_9BACT|nr:MAG: Similarity [uncultured Sulfurovum sp.]
MNKYIITFILMIQSLFSVGITAGTEIKNIAYLNYNLESVPFSATSNELIDIVDQKIDMQIVCQESEAVIVGVGEQRRAMRFILNNTGNGTDSYVFSSIEGDVLDFKVSNADIYLDNGDGIFSVEDSLATEIDVLSDGNISLFLVSDIPEDASNFSENGIKASSIIQGSLDYGESKKLENFYAVALTEESAKSDVCTYEVSNLAVALEKTAILSSDKLYKGSTIEYKIAVNVIGEGSIDNIVVNDNIPTGTVYVDNSLKLDGVTAGDFNGTAISVVLPSINQLKENSEPKHHITFDVKVQ